MKLIAFLGFILTVMSTAVQAQSFKNTSWRTFIGEPLHDSITIHIRTDSSFVTTSDGSVVVKSVCKISEDSLTISDYDGQYACQDMTGRYKVSLKDDIMTLVLVDDACEGRANNLNNSKWRKVPEK